MFWDNDDDEVCWKVLTKLSVTIIWQKRLDIPVANGIKKQTLYVIIDKLDDYKIHVKSALFRLSRYHMCLQQI